MTNPTQEQVAEVVNMVVVCGFDWDGMCALMRADVDYEEEFHDSHHDYKAYEEACKVYEEYIEALDEWEAQEPDQYNTADFYEEWDMWKAQEPQPEYEDEPELEDFPIDIYDYYILHPQWSYIFKRYLPVIFEWNGLTIWGRCFTGQSIEMDRVWTEMTKEFIEKGII